jgi:uncharacterized membrane protein
LLPHFYTPAGIILGWGCILATGVIHAFYFWFVGIAYERGDLSLVYPLSRGSGPLFVPILAVLILNEQLSIPGIYGIALVILGIFIIHLRSFAVQSFFEPFLALRGRASLWALCTYLMFVISLLLLSPYVFVRVRSDLKKEWNINKIQILIVGFLDLFTYLMILFALQISKLSYVAAAREVSIVFSALLGIMLLQEKNAPQKLVGAVLISLGVILIGLSR